MKSYFLSLHIILSLAKFSSDLKKLIEGHVPPYNVTCDRIDKSGVGVTVISHKSEDRTLVYWCVRRVIHLTFSTRKPVFCSSRVSSMSPHSASSLSSMIALIYLYSRTIMLGGCHVILIKWRTGVEQNPAVISAHAEWTPHAQRIKSDTVVPMIKIGE